MEMSLRDRYIIARWAYAIGVDYMSDMEYRNVDDMMKTQYPDDEYVNRSWSDDPCPIDLLKKYDMMDLYRDIKFDYKSESIDSINNEDDFKVQYRNLNARTRVSYKLDGFNIQVNYYNGEVISAETRGRTGNSMNANIVTQIVPKKIPILGKVKVTGELVIPNSKWQVYKIQTGNSSQRSSVSTALANGDTDVLQFVAFNLQIEGGLVEGNPYERLTELGFKHPRCTYVESFAALDNAVTAMGVKSKLYDYPTDGLVVETPTSQLAVRIREWKEDMLCSYVTGFSENIGIYGNAIVADIRPIVVDGAERRKVSVTNLQYVKDTNLRIGYPIAFNIRSAVNCVLNVTKTLELQRDWNGKYDEFRSFIDSKCSQ